MHILLWRFFEFESLKDGKLFVLDVFVGKNEQYKGEVRAREIVLKTVTLY